VRKKVMSLDDQNQIPVAMRLKYSLINTPNTFKYLAKCLIAVIKGKPIYRRVKYGHKFIGFDGTEYEYVKE
jgi:hypothetical protein